MSGTSKHRDNESKSAFFDSAYMISRHIPLHQVAKHSEALRKPSDRAEREEPRRVRENIERATDWQKPSLATVAIQLIGDSLLVINWLRGIWSVKSAKYRQRVADIQNLIDQNAVLVTPSGVRTPSNTSTEKEMKQLTHSHVARELGSVWRTAPPSEQSAAYRCFFDGGKDESKTSMGWHLEAARSTANGPAGWRTVAQKAKQLDKDATITECEFAAAEDGFRALLCVAVEGTVRVGDDGEIILRGSRKRKLL
mmetsp:Transcript_76618/g.173303  ORF Transcript_76618/g.173303 Transcript_76618/m.173303 type:complete len:253 (-) Transcript_76618:5-763(-)